MFDDRDIRFDLAALGLLVLVVFLGLSLATYQPTDPPVALVYPFDQWYQPDVLAHPLANTTHNACGRWGSLVSTILLDTFGLCAYFLIASAGVFAICVLRNREFDSLVLRFVGWLITLLGLTTLAGMVLPGWCEGSVMGPGGWLGALGDGILKFYFAGIGGFIVAVSLTLGGLLLCTDYVLVHLGLMLGTLTVNGMLAGRRAGKLRQNDVDGELNEYEEEEQDEAAESNELSVRMGGRKIRLMDEPSLEESDYEESDEDEDEVEVEVEYGDDEEADDEVDSDDEEHVDEADDRDEVDAAAEGATKGATLMRGRDGKRRLAPFRVRRPPADPEQDREAVMCQLDAASLQEGDFDYQLPNIELLDPPEDFPYESQEKEVRRKARILEKTFADFGFNVKVVEIETGPVIAQYEVALEAGLRLSKITGLADDLAIALRVPSVRIVAPIPGKNTVGIEVPNEERQLVRLREVMTESTAKLKKMNIPIFLGQDVSGNPLTVDLAKLPHLLIAGRTGTGKSVCLNAIIASILMTRRPDEVRMLMIDPKMVELSGYKSLPHLMHPVVTDMRKAEAILAWAVEKMEERYSILARAGVRHVSSYNQLGKEELMERMDPQSEEERRAIPLHMPFIVIVADEMADLMMTSGKEVEQHIIRLAQKSRAVGIHLILATQKPTVDVITGLIKSNLPARIAFQVASRTDSRVVLDEMGADKLLGNGDMLFLYPGTSMLIRGQGTYLSDEEINAVVKEASQGEQNFVKELVQLKVEDEQSNHTPESLKRRDELYEKAIEIVIGEGRGSCSLLQRALGIGYGRAARLIDFMAEDGIVGAYAGSQAREVLMTMADFEALQSAGDEEPPSTLALAKSSSPAAGRPVAMAESEEAADADDEYVEDDEADEEEFDEGDEGESDEGESDEEESDEGESDEGESDEGDEGESLNPTDEEAAEEDDEYEYEYEYEEVDEDDPDAEYDEEYEYEEEEDEELEESA